MKTRVVLAVLALLFPGLPFLTVLLIPTDSPEPYVFKARIVEKLGETLGGKLQYFLAEELEGSAPAAVFVVTVDIPYTRGISRLDLEKHPEAWMQGGIMTPEIYYGEQYLFFGHTQLYIRQVRTGALWPDQVTELGILYLSPLTAFLSLWYVFSFPFMEEFALPYYLLMIAQSALIIAAIVFIVRRRPTGTRLAMVLLSYGIVAMLTTVPMLHDLY